MTDAVNCAGVGGTGLPSLPNTGFPVAAMLTVGGASLVAGLLFLLLARSRRSGISAAVIVLLFLTGGLASGLVGPAPAHASAPPCATPSAPPASNYLTIRQTSTITGLAPGVAAATIIGVVVNHGNDSAFVTSVMVSMVSVAQTVVHAPGACTTSDYLLTEVTMPVNERLGPGQSAGFGGARISFRNKSTNQDACKGATVRLRYVSS